MRIFKGCGLIIACLGLPGLAVSPASAQEGKGLPRPVESRNLNESLKEVINRGAKIFNENGDYAGCYRIYEGALVSVRPFVSKDLQKEIDIGLGNASRMPSFADKAFELRRVLDAIRRADVGTSSTDKSGEKKTPEKELPKGATVTGIVTFKGRPVASGKVLFAAMEGSAAFKSNIEAGKYSVTGLPVGKYQITVTGSGLPAAVADPKRGIVYRVSTGEQTFDIDLIEPAKVEDPRKEILGEPKKTRIDEEGKPDPKKEILGEPKKTKLDDGIKAEPRKTDMGPFGDIMGTVKVEGRPLTDGQISLVSEGRPRYTTKLEKDGAYKFGNVAVGRYRIVIEPGKKEETLVDPRYRDAERSGLQFEVQKGRGVFDILLRGPRK